MATLTRALALGARVGAMRRRVHPTGFAPKTTLVAAPVVRGASVVAAANKDVQVAYFNNLYDNSDMKVKNPSGEEFAIGEVTKGKTAKRLHAQQPAFEAAGYKLVVLSIGKPEGGKEFCEKVPVPEDLLFLDLERNVYKSLELYEGMSRTFFNAATPAAIMRNGMEEFKKATANYTMIAPPTVDDAFQQGGLLILDGDKVLYAHKDEGTADHAPMADVLGVCCPGATEVTSD